MADETRVALTVFEKKRSRRNFLTGAASFGAAAIAPQFSAAQSQSIVVTTFGGIAEKAFRESLVEPFERETGVKVTLKLGSMSEWLTSAMVNRRKPDIDVLWLTFPESIRAVAEQDVVMQLSQQKIPNLTAVRPIWLEMFDGKGVGHEYTAYGIGYRTDLVKDAPKSYADFWNPKYAGQIGLPDISSSGSWEFLVMATKLHGGDESNLEPGIEAIKRLKPSIKRFYKSSTEATTMLDAGEVAIIGPMVDFRIYALQDQGRPVKYVTPAEGTFPSLASFHIAKNTPNAASAEKFINFALSQPGLTNFCNTLLCSVPRSNIQLNEKATSRTVPFEELIIFDWRKVIPQMKRYTEIWNREVVR